MICNFHIEEVLGWQFPISKRGTCQGQCINEVNIKDINNKTKNFVYGATFKDAAYETNSVKKKYKVQHKAQNGLNIQYCHKRFKFNYQNCKGEQIK